MGAQAISLPRRGEGGAPLRRVNLRADAMLPVADDPLVPADTGQMAPAVWLVAAHSEGETVDHKLFIVDFDGKPESIFPKLAEAVRL